MRQYTSSYSAHASLAVVGNAMRQMHIWEEVEAAVNIHQKTVKHRPLDKLKDAFVTILAGGQGMVEVNTRLRADRGLQQAFGRSRCAEQSSVSQTLNRCTHETVSQMKGVLRQLYQRHSQGYRHDYQQRWQLLDVDLSGLPGGRQGEGVSKGYFAGRPHCRGRQLGRVLATHYDEIVNDCLYEGRRQLSQSVQSLIEESEQVLSLDLPKRQRTLVRIDSGGGQDKDINWLLERGYEILIKMHSGTRATKLARTVTAWEDDPKSARRQVALLPVGHPYLKPTQQVAVRVPKADGTWAYSVVVCTAPIALLRELTGHRIDTPTDHVLAIAHAYDLRGGGAETQFKGDKQGLGLTKRHKQRFDAQEMLVLLAQLAHNLLIWLRSRLMAVDPRFQHFGILRLVRDVGAISGQLHFDAYGHLVRLRLSRDHPLAGVLCRAFADRSTDLRLILSKI